MLATGFPPLAGDHAHTLILGSLPGIASIKNQQYYAHPHNSFWRLLGALTHFSPDSPYAERCQAALAAGLAIWDVCHSAQRNGSLDSAIAQDSVCVNDIAGLLKSYPTITTLAFNGQTAAKLFQTQAKRTHQLREAVQSCRLVTLPSSSPAHASLSFEQKLQQWRVLLAVADSA